MKWLKPPADNATSSGSRKLMLMPNAQFLIASLRFINRYWLAVSGLVLTLAGCSTIAPYDQVAYEHATSTKAEALLLMDKASMPYNQNTQQTDAVILDLNKAYEYDKGRPRNQITVQLWTKLLSPNANLFGGFLRYWKSRGELHPAYIQEKKKDIEDAFDQIIQLEQGKQRLATS